MTYNMQDSLNAVCTFGENVDSGTMRLMLAPYAGGLAWLTLPCFLFHVLSRRFLQAPVWLAWLCWMPPSCKCCTVILSLRPNAVKSKIKGQHTFFFIFWLLWWLLCKIERHGQENNWILRLQASWSLLFGNLGCVGAQPTPKKDEFCKRASLGCAVVPRLAFCCPHVCVAACYDHECFLWLFHSFPQFKDSHPYCADPGLSQGGFGRT